MPRFLFTLTRPRVIIDILEIPIQASDKISAKSKLFDLVNSDDYDQSLYVVDSEVEPLDDAWPFKLVGPPKILNDE